MTTNLPPRQNSERAHELITLFASHLSPLVHCVKREGFFTGDFARVVLKRSERYDTRWEELFCYLEELEAEVKHQHLELASLPTTSAHFILADVY